MIASFNRLFDKAKPAFAQERTFERCLYLGNEFSGWTGTADVSGMLCASAQQFNDGSAAYRLFEQ